MSARHQSPADSHGATSRCRQFLGFDLAGERYAIPILDVQEIRGYSPLTRLPDAPSWIAGLLSLRGRVVPVLDLRRHFGLPGLPASSPMPVIVVVIRAGVVAGLQVDAVAEVLDIESDDVRLAPAASGDARAVPLVASRGDGLVLLLDLDCVLQVPGLASNVPPDAA